MILNWGCLKLHKTNP